MRRTVRVAARLLLLLLLCLLTSCAGTLAVGFEQTPTPDPAPAATLQALVEENQRLSIALATAVAPPPPAPTAPGPRGLHPRWRPLADAMLPDGPHQRLTIDGHNREPHWSNSGEWIAYRKDRTVLIERDRPCEEPLREGQPPCRETVSTFQQQVWLARRNGAEQHVINRGFTVERFAWSPTNDLLAYVTDAGHLQILDPATDIGLRLVTAQANGRVNAIAWSPDGSRLAYEWVSDDQNGPGSNRDDGIWVIPATGGQAVRLLRATQLPASLAGWRDPKHVLIWQHPSHGSPAGRQRVVVLGALPLPGEPVSRTEVVLAEPMLPRPDFLAVAPATEHVHRGDCWGRPADLDQQTRRRRASSRSPASLAAMTPAWSPEGAWLAFVGNARCTRFGTGRRRIDGLVVSASVGRRQLRHRHERAS